MSLIAGSILFAFGSLISLCNFYLSFIRYLLHKLLSPEKKYRWVSGFPIFGSLFLVVAAFLLSGLPVLMWCAIGIAIIDTGGIHWFIGVLLWHAVIKK